MVDGIDLILLALITMTPVVLTQVGPFLDDLLEIIVDVGGQSTELLYLVAENVAERDHLLDRQCLPSFELLRTILGHPGYDGSVALLVPYIPILYVLG